MDETTRKWQFCHFWLLCCIVVCSMCYVVLCIYVSSINFVFESLQLWVWLGWIRFGLGGGWWWGWWWSVGGVVMVVVVGGAWWWVVVGGGGW
jgi:hypothetical protein